MSEQRIIKKYPNRRLYDTTESKYITLSDIRHLVFNNIDFCVVDKKTGENITRSTLLQIIIEQEEESEPIFTTDVLSQIIRFYGDAVQGLAGNYLEKSLNMFTEQQRLFREQIADTMKANPLTAMSELTQRNLELWHKMQEQFFHAAGADSASRAVDIDSQKEGQGKSQEKKIEPSEADDMKSGVTQGVK